MRKFFGVMKKIGIDARFFTERATGIGRHVFELVQGLAKLDTKNEYTLFLKPKEFEIFQLPSSNFKKEKTTAPHYSFDEQVGFLRQLNKHQFDLMVFPHFNAPIFYRRKYVVTIHDLTLHFFPGKKKSDLISRVAYKTVINTVVRNAEHCFAVSENTKRDMVKHLKIPKNKITVTYNGVTQQFKSEQDDQIQKSFKSKYNLPKKYFLYNGVQRSHKNILGLIQAYAIFLKKNPDSEIDLVFAGPSNDTYTEIPSQIDELDLQDRIHMLGFFPEADIEKLISGATAYVFPSFYEGFGLPPLEAMRCGTPVACSHTSSLPEVCGEAAVYFDPKNIDDIALAMEKVVFDIPLRKDLVEKGFVQSQKFRWSDMVKRMLEEYQKIK